MNKKLNPSQILSKSGLRYQQLKLSKMENINSEFAPEIKSDQVKAVVQVLCEEINKILGEK